MTKTTIATILLAFNLQSADIEFPVILSNTNGHMVKLVEKSDGTSISNFQDESYKGVDLNTNTAIEVFNSYTNKGYTISTNEYASKLLRKNRPIIVYDFSKSKAITAAAIEDRKRIAYNAYITSQKKELIRLKNIKKLISRDVFDSGDVHESYRDGWGNYWALVNGKVVHYSPSVN
jgi:hypothetical protein